jgi:hypothetical protein
MRPYSSARPLHAAQPDCACAGGQGLRTAYGVGEQAGSLLTNSVVELCFTSSVRFLQPGLLLKVGAARPRRAALQAVATAEEQAGNLSEVLAMCNSCMHTGDIVHSPRSGAS